MPYELKLLSNPRSPSPTALWPVPLATSIANNGEILLRISYQRSQTDPGGPISAAYLWTNGQIQPLVVEMDRIPWARDELPSPSPTRSLNVQTNLGVFPGAWFPFRIYYVDAPHIIVGTAHIPGWPGAAVPEVTTDIRGFHIEAASTSPFHGFAELPLVITKDAALTAVTSNAWAPTTLINLIGFATNKYSGESRAFRQRTPSHQNWWLNPLKGHRHSVAYDGNVDLTVGLSWDTPGGARHLVAWDAVGEPRDLGEVLTVRAVSPDGMIIGQRRGRNGKSSAFRLDTRATHPQFEDLGTLPGGTASEAMAINASGQVVGWSFDARGYQRAVWFSGNGSVGDFRSAITRGRSSIWPDLVVATSINDSGLVVGMTDVGVTYSKREGRSWLLPAQGFLLEPVRWGPGDPSIPSRSDIRPDDVREIFPQQPQWRPYPFEGFVDSHG